MGKFKLWKDLDLKDDNINTTYSILQEYAKDLEDMVKNVLYIKLNSYNLGNNKKKDYGLATDFDIVCPELDGYTYTLFTVYGNPEKEYPIAIDCHAYGENEIFSQDAVDYLCKNENELINALKEISGDNKVQKIIKSLYIKNK